MARNNEPFTFRPPRHRRGLRVFLGIVFSVLAIGGALLGAAVVWLPRALDYEVDGEKVVVTNGLKIHPTRRVFPLNTITSATAVRLKPGKRVAGTSLPGYCSGHFRFPDLGDCTLATTCSRDAVLLRTTENARPMVITPGRREAFLAALGGNERYRETIRLGDGGTTWRWFRILTSLGAAATLFIPVIFFLSPGRLKYRITPGFVEVDLTFWTKRFDTTNCLARLYDPETFTKVMGSSLPGYHSGRFSLDGMITRVYATSPRNGVLIESPDLRLFLSPEDPHAFLEGLRAHGNLEIEHQLS